jgi:hypothetical protein
METIGLWEKNLAIAISDNWYELNPLRSFGLKVNRTNDDRQNRLDYKFGDRFDYIVVDQADYLSAKDFNFIDKVLGDRGQILVTVGSEKSDDFLAWSVKTKSLVVDINFGRENEYRFI